jgi:competence protein ComEA
MKIRSILTLFLSLFVVISFICTDPALARTSKDSSTNKTSKVTKSKSKTKKKGKTSKTKKKSKAKNKSKTKKKAASKTTSKSKSKAKVRTGKVNINTADAKTLTEFTGIGPVTAKKIIAYRRKNGKFRTASDLMNVKGIGEKTMKKMKPQLKF